MAFGDVKITTPEELQAAIAAEPNYACVDNPTMAARVAAPPPPEVLGLAPAGAYDAHCGYKEMHEFPVASEFKYALPDPAVLPKISDDAKAAFNLDIPAATPGPDYKMDV